MGQRAPPKRGARKDRRAGFQGPKVCLVRDVSFSSADNPSVVEGALRCWERRERICSVVAIQSFLLCTISLSVACASPLTGLNHGGTGESEQYFNAKTPVHPSLFPACSLESGHCARGVVPRARRCVAILGKSSLPLPGVWPVSLDSWLLWVRSWSWVKWFFCLHFLELFQRGVETNVPFGNSLP